MIRELLALDESVASFRAAREGARLFRPDAEFLVINVAARLFEPSVSAGVVKGTHRPVLVVSGTGPDRPDTNGLMVVRR